MNELKSELVLNPEYYSADVYMEEEENKKSIYLSVFIQLLMVSIILALLIFGYKYIMKNHYDDIDLWMMETKASMLGVKEKVPVVMGKEVVVSTEAIISTVEAKAEVVKKNSMQVSSTPKVIAPTVQPQELSNEYIKLVEKSLGNY
ncbi:MAG: Unknown protein [uncultured Sulfurovum sp.]|uniref:Uncharacterized protein n=1 Tax=uncultured Sulfurovum sp. TaxID=269237 RepID=A0A6S6TP96_9BACT|nr:MAG: Unknown protein [uncultured Sulfurovum sp.]